MKKYKCGLYIGRFQPLHVGHTSIIDKMLDECEKVIIAIGSAQEGETQKNPFKFSFREEMIEETYSAYLDKLMIVPVRDRVNPSDDSSWGDYLFERVYEWCGEIPDVIYEGEEVVRTHWYDNIEISIVKVPRTILPISGTILRNAMIWNNKHLVLEHLPCAIHKYYDKMREVILKCYS